MKALSSTLTTCLSSSTLLTLSAAQSAHAHSSSTASEPLLAQWAHLMSSPDHLAALLAAAGIGIALVIKRFNKNA